MSVFFAGEDINLVIVKRLYKYNIKRLNLYYWWPFHISLDICNALLHKHFSRILLKLWLSFFFAYILGIPFSRNISYLVVTSESIVSNILIIKKKKIFSFSQKHVAKNSKLLSENLKVKAKLKNMKSQECY